VRPAPSVPRELYPFEGRIFDRGGLRYHYLDEGQGDPFLVTERVWQMLRRIRQAGIDTIDGDLLLDDSYFDVGEHDPGAFDRQPLRAYNVAPNALLMNFKVVRYWFAPADESGKVDIWTDPPLDNLEIENRLRLIAGPCRGYQRGITVTTDEQVSRILFGCFSVLQNLEKLFWDRNSPARLKRLEVT